MKPHELKQCTSEHSHILHQAKAEQVYALYHAVWFLMWVVLIQLINVTLVSSSDCSEQSSQSFIRSCTCLFHYTFTLLYKCLGLMPPLDCNISEGRSCVLLVIVLP